MNKSNFNKKYQKLTNRSPFFVAGDEEQFLEALNYDINEEIINTFRYIFYKISRGYFVRILNNNLLFLPFVNVNFKNEWSNIIKENNKMDTENDVKNFIRFSSLYTKYWHIKIKFNINKSFEEYYKNNYKNFKFDNYETNIEKWYSNNSLFRFDKDSIEKENILEVYDMLDELVKNHKVKDTDFFINTRDCPILTKDKTEPYYYIFGNTNLVSHNYKKYSKILSFSKSFNYKDILIPNFDDWQCIKNIKDYELNWENKKNKIIFRGSTTGFGYSPDTNKRLLLSTKYKNIDKILDIGITKIQLRPRIIYGKIKFLKDINKIIIKDKLTYKEQSLNKFILNVEGNVSAFRLSSELFMKSCILLVDSEWKVWYSDLLKPYVHYVPIKSDLSDLQEKISWVKENDKKCKKIASNSYSLACRVFNKENIFKYLLNKIN